MKPMIIVVNPTENKNIILSESQLKEIIDMAYNDGYSDGCRNYPYLQYTPPNYPYFTTATSTSTMSGNKYKNYSNITLNSVSENNKSGVN